MFYGFITYNGIEDVSTILGQCAIISKVRTFRSKKFENMKYVMDFIIPYCV